MDQDVTRDQMPRNNQQKEAEGTGGVNHLLIIGLIVVVLVGFGIRNWQTPSGRGQTKQSSTVIAELVPVNTSNNYSDPFAGEMIGIKGGTFQMGTEDSYWEKPVHSVTVGDYWIGKYEVTQAQWRSVMGMSPSYFKDCDQCPVEKVLWDDIQDFIQKLNTKTGKTYRLPTEAEWEYAAGGGNGSRTTYAGTSSEGSLGSYAWYYNNGESKMHPVGQKQPNSLGLYDMSGNVWERCADWYGEYSSGVQTNPKGPSEGVYRVLRGGGWGSFAGDCRVAYRYDYSPDYRNYAYGFRLARQF